MSCCDKNCNQGRDCPNRVAKIGQRYPAYPKPLRAPRTDYLRELAKILLWTIASMLVGSTVVMWVLYA